MADDLFTVPARISFDVRSLGEPKSSLLTESEGTIMFEHGSIVTTPFQFFALQRALVRIPTTKGPKNV